MRITFNEAGIAPANTEGLRSALDKERRAAKEASERATGLESQVSERDATIKDLQAKDPDGLVKKHEAILAETNEKHKAENQGLEDRFLRLAREHAISGALMKAGARDVPKLARLLAPDIREKRGDDGKVVYHTDKAGNPIDTQPVYEVLDARGIARDKPKAEGSLDSVPFDIDDLVGETKADETFGMLFNAPHAGGGTGAPGSITQPGGGPSPSTPTGGTERDREMAAEVMKGMGIAAA